MANGRPGGRWLLRPRLTALTGAGVVGAVVIGLIWLAGGDSRVPGGEDHPNAHASPGSQPPGRPVAWDGARLVRGQPERLTLYFTGRPPGRPDDPCVGTYQAMAVQGSDRMTVTVHELAGPPLSPGHGCADVGYGRTATIELPEPLRDRPVIDGATGEERLVSDAGLLLIPSWLPSGYRFVRERVEFGIDSREWAPPGPDERLLVDQGDPDKLARPGNDPVVLARPVVRGVPAIVWKTRRFDDLMCVSWAEGAMGHRVCTSGTKQRLLAIEELIRVADGLRG